MNIFSPNEGAVGDYLFVPSGYADSMVAKAANLDLDAALVIGGGFTTPREITVREHAWLN